MDTILKEAIQSIQNSDISFSKYITANDTGFTGGHQSGFHIHKNSWNLFFQVPGKKGSNKDKYVTIKWQNTFETSSRFIYYGKGTRNEYRLTRFGKGFPFLSDDNIGNLLIICRKSETYYEAFVLHKDEDIEDFFAELNISSSDTNGIIPTQFEKTSEGRIYNCFLKFLNTLHSGFPTTMELSTSARSCYNNAYSITDKIIKANPDKEILNWLDTEFRLFKTIENNIYSKQIQIPFKTVDELVITANTILNRRKSRAGKSLEHHLTEIFKTFSISFEAQTITEDKKKPDFIFPSLDAYLNPNYDINKLFILAAKTTCKDRWRQVLNEADRVKTKHLFTLQQGISKNQLEEMYKYDVCLVVPKAYIRSFPEDFRNRILTLEIFTNKVLTSQN